MGCVLVQLAARPTIQISNENITKANLLSEKQLKLKVFQTYSWYSFLTKTVIYELRITRALVVLVLRAIEVFLNPSSQKPDM